MDGHVIQGVVFQSFEQEGYSNIPSNMIKKISKSIATLIKEQNYPISRKECAKLLGVSVPTLDTYIKNNDILYRVKNPNAKSRKHYIFFKNEVLEWQKSRLSDFSKNNGRIS